MKNQNIQNELCVLICNLIIFAYSVKRKNIYIFATTILVIAEIVMRHICVHCLVTFSFKH